MTLPFALPDWLPWWVPIVVLVPALLWLLAFLFVPFSVLGTRGRLEAIEARLDEIQGEIRSLALRLPELGGGRIYEPRPIDEGYALPPQAQRPAPRDPPLPDRPPIPPPAPDWYDAAEDERAPLGGRAGMTGAASRDERSEAAARARAEPRLSWPRR